MPRTFQLATPLTVGTVSKPITVSSLQITTVYYSTTPELAPLGTGELDITLTDPVSGWQETVSYQDASVLTLWQSIGDGVAQALFAKLIADGKLPAGTVSAT
jgi:hypothetical protein